MLAKRITPAPLQREQAWPGSKPWQRVLIGACKLSSNVGSCKILSNNLISVIKETF